MLNLVSLKNLEKYLSHSMNNNSIDFEEFKDIRQEYEMNTGEWLRDYYNFIIQYVADNNDFTAGTMGELCAVYEILTKSGYKNEFDLLEGLFNKSEMDATFVTLLKVNNAFGIPKDTIGELIVQQIQGGGDNQYINRLLSDNHYKINQDDIITVDKYIASQTSELIIPEILEKYFCDNNIDAIPQTVKSVIDNAFLTRSELGVKSVEILLDEKNTGVNKQIDEALKNACTYNRSDYSSIAEILDYYAGIDKEAVIRIITPNIAISINNILSNDFILFMANIAFRLKEKDAFQEIITKFVHNILTRIISHNQFSDAMATLLNMLADYVDDESFKKVQPILHKKINKENLEDIYELYNRKNDVFGNDDGQIEPAKHVDVCLRMLEAEKDINNVLRTLKDEYSSITEIVKLAHLVANIEVNKKLAFDTLSAFIIYKLDKESEQVEGVKSICGIIESEGCDFVFEVFDNRVDIRTKVAVILMDNSKGFSFDEIVVLVGWMLSQPMQKEGYSNFDSIISVLVARVNSNAQLEDVISLLDEIPNEIIKSKKEKYKSIYVELLCKNYSNSLNERIVNQAVRVGSSFAKKVVDAAPSNMNEELTGYLKNKKE